MIRRGFGLVLPLALIGACSSQTEKEQPQTRGQPTLHEMMTEKIDPDADVIWGIGNAAIDDQASIDPAKMQPENWLLLEQAATRMAGDSRTLAALDPVIVTRPGVKIADEGTPGAPTTQDIERHLARDHDLYRALADSLAQHADSLAAAAKARDAAAAGRLVNELDGVCEACHLEFWYPEQKAFVENIMAEANAAGQ